MRPLLKVHLVVHMETHGMISSINILVGDGALRRCVPDIGASRPQERSLNRSLEFKCLRPTIFFDFFPEERGSTGGHVQAVIKCSICPYAADICRHFEFKSKRSLAPCEHIRIICMYRTKDMYIDV